MKTYCTALKKLNYRVHYPLILIGSLLCFLGLHQALLAWLSSCKFSFKGHPADLAGRIVSLVHVLVIGLGAIGYLIGFIPFTTWQKLLHVTQGYLGASLISMLQGNHLLSLYFHHALLIVFILLYMDLGPSHLAQGLLSEIAMPPFHYSWYLLHTGVRTGFAFLLASGLTLLLYFLLRVCNFTYLLYKLYKKGDYLYVIGFLPIALLNYYWFIILLQKALALC